MLFRSVKTAAFAAFVRLFTNTFGPAGGWGNVVWVMAALTLLSGNITAVFQKSTKRMLAYSGVAHAGYMLLALLAANEYSSSSVFFYAAAYSVASLSMFCVLQIVVSALGNDTVNAFAGLAKRNKSLAFAATVALLSLAGIPPTTGFFAKY